VRSRSRILDRMREAPRQSQRGAGANHSATADPALTVSQPCPARADGSHVVVVGCETVSTAKWIASSAVAGTLAPVPISRSATGRCGRTGHRSWRNRSLCGRSDAAATGELSGSSSLMRLASGRPAGQGRVPEPMRWACSWCAWTAVPISPTLVRSQGFHGEVVGGPLLRSA